MARSAKFQIANLYSLERAWKDINQRVHGQKRKTVGIDGVSVEQYTANVQERLKSLSRDIKASEPYVFSSLRAVQIPKPNGKLRVICIPTVRDRIVQRALLNYLSEGDKCKLNNNISYGFARATGNTLQRAIMKAKTLRKEHPWVYKTDISSFFDRIDRADLFEQIKTRVRAKSIHDTLLSCINCEIFEPDNARHRSITRQGIKKGKGVRQGMPLSPFFANLVLRRFDNAIQSKGFFAIRYADDLIFFADNEAQCVEIHDFCKNGLRSIGHTIPDPGTEKTQIYNPSATAEYLGMGLVFVGTGYSLEITKAQIDKIRESFLKNSDVPSLLHQNITVSRLTSRLNNAVSGYLEAYAHASNIDQLSTLLPKWKNHVIRKIFSTQLGIKDVSTLSATTLKFFELQT